MNRSCQRLLFLLLLALPMLALASVFDVPELRVTPSPSEPMQIRLAEGVRVVDFDVSPVKPTVALLAARPTGAQEILFWDIGQPQAVKISDVPPGFSGRSLSWHPQGEAFFLAGAFGQGNAIFRVTHKGGSWASQKIYDSRQEIRRLVPGPRPYATTFNDAGERSGKSYRLFFGSRATNGSYAIRSITEDGRREYQVVGRKENMTRFKDADGDPSELVSSYALPVGFHPAGHLLLWEDGNHCFQVASYGRDHWDKSAKFLGGNVCGGTISATPNGLGLLHWVPGTAGIELVLQRGTVRRKEAADYQLTSSPSSVPDGRGIVGITKTTAGLVVNYVPINVPLNDSVNAWMYTESAQDTQLLSQHGGLFRDLASMDQLYSLYDTESYACGRLDESIPTRPYFVTTDSFWELFAAAYEGIFVVRERQSAIPAFWQFIEKASTALRRSSSQSPWAKAFAALAALQAQPQSNEEAKRVLSADGPRFSPILGAQFDYGELKPRGHYTATPETQRYFRAFRYLSQISKLKWGTDDLSALPSDVKTAAMRWIASYQDMMSPSRAPLIWQSAAWTAPAYSKHPLRAPALFPMSWGFDNEILFSTTFHSELPENEQIVGPAGQRLQPTALDIAAALGSGFARGLLRDEIVKYPKLDGALTELEHRFPKAGPTRTSNLYQLWIDTLAVQWADSTPSPNGKLDEALWHTKRLQTGLASWATLRHATVLVNERNSAECGEGGFEFIVMRPPRGYVEPDPEMFGRFAALFEATMRLVSSDGLAGLLPDEEGIDAKNRAALKQGLLRRLSETAAKARLFQSIATKEVQGQPLTAQDYEEILYFGRVAEHHFLVFKSLANKDLALSTPNPIPKVADVSGVAGHAPYLMAAVGRPLEWDHTVPYFGRHEVVKGAAYSFYEFSSNSLLNDAEWAKKLPSQQHPAWVAPYVSSRLLSCPARDPF